MLIRNLYFDGAMDHWECRPWTLEYIDEHYGDRMVTIRKSDIEGSKRLNK